MEEGIGTEPEMRLAAPWKAGFAVRGDYKGGFSEAF